MKHIISDKAEVHIMVKQIVMESFRTHVEEWDMIKDSEPKKEMLRAMERVFDLTIRAQREKGKEDIAFINVHYLRASLLDGSFSLLINTYSEKHYLDDVVCLAEWIPTEIKRFFMEDMVYLEKMIIQKNIIISQRELYDIKKKHYFDYLFLLLIQIKQCSNDIISIKEFMQMKKANIYFILYGEIYGRLIPVYKGW